MKEISWFTLPGLGMGHGYGNAGVHIIQSLQDKDIKVSYQTEYPNVSISFAQPQFYAGIEHQYKVGYTPWESDQLPIMWPARMKEMDEIWTTSHFCQRVFKEHEVNSWVLPHGVDPEIYPICYRTLTDRFIFLHVGGPTARKGAQRVVDAFCDLFDDRDDVILILKSQGPVDARWRRGWQGYGNNYDFYGGNASNHPRIAVIETMLDEEGMKDLYQRAHCMVYPTNGEGFGLIPFNAIASGLPTIVTNATGCEDFAACSMPLDSKPAPGEGVHLGNWVEPDRDHLRELMLYAVNNWEQERDKAMRSAKIIHNTQTWGHIADKIIQQLGDKIEYNNDNNTNIKSSFS